MVSSSDEAAGWPLDQNRPATKNMKEMKG